MLTSSRDALRREANDRRVARELIGECLEEHEALASSNSQQLEEGARTLDDPLLARVTSPVSSGQAIAPSPSPPPSPHPAERSPVNTEPRRSKRIRKVDANDGLNPKRAKSKPGRPMRSTRTTLKRGPKTPTDVDEEPHRPQPEVQDSLQHQKRSTSPGKTTVVPTDVPMI